MAKKKTTAVPIRKQTWLAANLAGLAAFVSAGAATYVLAEQPTPLDAPVPRPPKPIFTLVTEAAAVSFSERRMTKSWLPKLAPQPDGVPAMLQGYVSELLGFTIRYPFGSEVVVFGYDSFSKDSVDSQATVGMDQPLAAIKVTVPTNEGRTQLEYARKVLDEAAQSGAQPVEQPREAELPGGTFATIAYRRSDANNNYVHRIYFAAASKRIVIIDFMLRPEQADAGEKYVAKIMRSFEPGDVLGPAMEKPAKPQPDEEKQSAAPQQTPAN
jgi:hypothetical protein